LRGKHSVSGYWLNRYDYGGGGSYFKSTTEEKRFRQFLGRIARSVNVVRNAGLLDDEEDERHLTVKWSDGSTKNDPSKDMIYLSPDVLSDKNCAKPDWTEGQLTDVLTGHGMVEATMRRTVDPKVVQSAFRSPKKQGRKEMVLKLFHTLETLYAEQDLAYRYPGFKGYPEATREYFTKDKVKETIEHFGGPESPLPEKHPEVALAGLTWNLLHPDDHVGGDMDQEYLDAIKWAEELVPEHFDVSKDRLDVTKKVIAEFIKRFPPPPEKEGEGEGEGEGASSPQGQGMPDGNQMGKSVSGFNDSESNESGAGKEITEQAASTNSKDADKSNTLNTRMVESHVEAEFIRPDGLTRSTYMGLLRSRGLHARISIMKNRLKFRNELNTLTEHGLPRGDLDEGSLFKILLRRKGVTEHNLFERREIINAPNIVVGFMIDESGSMGGTEIEGAKEILIVMAEACKKIKGIEMCVMGQDVRGETVKVREYATRRQQDMSTVTQIIAHGGTGNGPALGYLYRTLVEDYPDCTQKLIIDISDGCPNVSPEPTMDGVQYTKHIVDEARAKGVEVCGIGVGRYFNSSTGEYMYGPLSFTHVRNFDNVESQVSNFVTGFAQKSKILSRVKQI
jgi:Mg-chelatase subunit ChlD